MPEETTVRVEAFALGAYQTNCYIVTTPGTDGAPAGCWVADCGQGPAPLLGRLAQLERDHGLTPDAFVLTHAHLDHIAGLHEARRRFPRVPIWIHAAEADWLTNAEKNLSAFSPTPVTAPPADRLLEDGNTLALAGQQWDVLHVPGHSPGSCAFFHAPSGVCISGDTLFAGSIGRTDFPGSSFQTLEASIREKLYTLPDATRILPGHGPETTVGREKASNQFVRG